MCVRVRPCVHKGPWCSKHKYQLSPWLASLLMPLRPQLQQIPQTPSSQTSQRMSNYCTWRRPQWAARILCPMTATCSSHCSPTQPTQPHLTSLRQVEHCILFLNLFINADVIWNVIEKCLLTQGLQALSSLKQKNPHCTWLCPPICSDRSVLIAYRTQSASHESPHLAGHTLSHEPYADRWARVQSSQSFHCFLWNVFCLQSLFLLTHVDALWFCWLHIVSLFQNLVSCLHTYSISDVFNCHIHKRSKVWAR